MPAASRPVLEIRADTAEFKRLFDRSSQVEPRLRGGLRRNLRQVATGAQKDVQRTVLGPPLHPSTTNRRHTGLRANIASGVKVAILTGNTRVGVAVVGSAAALNASQKHLLHAYGRAGGWRHPTFGKGKKGDWVTQVGRPGYFYQRIYAHRDETTRAVVAAMSEAAESLKGTP